MRNTYYKRKRAKSGLTRTDVARELDIPYTKYNAIEKGDVKMPSRLIDKFNEIINRGVQNQIIRTENMKEADAFWNEMKQKDENGTYKIISKAKEFNINGVRELTKLLGYKSSGTFYSYLTGSQEPSDGFKDRVYAFFEDELNIQAPKRNKGKPNKSKGKTYKQFYCNHNSSLKEFYENTDFKKLFFEHNITAKEVAEKIGADPSSLSRLVNKKGMMCKENMLKLKALFENKEPEITESDIDKFADDVVDANRYNIVDEFPIIPTEEETEASVKVPSVVEKYRNELDDVNELMVMYQEKIKELDIRRQVCIEVLQAIEEIEMTK